ncbi:hypothetical protein Tco_1209668 [Tanacetum coccineum]
MPCSCDRRGMWDRRVSIGQTSNANSGLSILEPLMELIIEHCTGKCNHSISNEMVRNKNDEVHEHVKQVLDIVSLFNIPEVSHDVVMLRIFPITLTGAAKLRAKPTKTLSQTYTRYKTLHNELANDGVNLSKYEINVGPHNYSSSTALSTAFFSSNVIQDFQENSDDEVDERSSEEYLKDLDIEFHERSLLVNSKRTVTVSETEPTTPSVPIEFKDMKQESKINELTKLVQMLIDEKDSLFHDMQKEDHRTSDHEMYTASLKRSENYNAQPYQYESLSKQILIVKVKPFPPCTHRSLNEHRPDDCRNYPECEICGSYDHFTLGHNRVIHLRGGVLAESSKSSKSSIGRHIKETIWYLDSECSRSMTGVKSYMHKYVEQLGPNVVFGDNSSCITEGYGSINCRGTIFNANKEIVLIAPRRNDVYVLDMYDNRGLSRLHNQSIERDRLIGIGFVLDFVEFISFTFGDKEMILFEISSWRGARVGVRTYLLGGAIDGSEANGIIRDPKLELESSCFTFDLVPLSYESVDVVVGENWLLRHKAEMVCHEKVVKMPWSCKVRVGSNGNLLWEASVLLGRKKGCVMDTLKFTAMPFGLTNAPAVFMELMSRVRSDLALPEGADDFVVYYDTRSKDLEACLEKGRSMKKDIASYGSKYLAYSEVEVKYQGSSGLLLQLELPESKWERITKDIVVKLPSVSSGYDASWV